MDLKKQTAETMEQNSKKIDITVLPISELRQVMGDSALVDIVELTGTLGEKELACYDKWLERLAEHCPAEHLRELEAIERLDNHIKSLQAEDNAEGEAVHAVATC